MEPVKNIKVNHFFPVLVIQTSLFFLKMVTHSKTSHLQKDLEPITQNPNLKYIGGIDTLK